MALLCTAGDDRRHNLERAAEILPALRGEAGGERAVALVEASADPDTALVSLARWREAAGRFPSDLEAAVTLFASSQSMALAVMFGLTFATVLTLVVVPSLYAIFVETFRVKPIPVAASARSSARAARSTRPRWPATTGTAKARKPGATATAPASTSGKETSIFLAWSLDSTGTTHHITSRGSKT